MPWLIPVAIGAGVGAIAGAIPKSSKQDWSSSIALNPASSTENFLAGTGVRKYTDSQIDAMINSGLPANSPNREAIAAGLKRELSSQMTTSGGGALDQNFSDIQGMVNAGPGQSDVTNSLNASRSLADMFDQYSKNGGLPSQEDISSSNSLAQNLFNPQRVAMQQAFQDQSVEANRQAALMGRSMNDPILAAKLAQEQTRQGATLEANQGAWAQNFALQQPDRRLDYANQHANILGGLATQAMSNRQALAAMGEGILSREREFRLAVSPRSGTQNSESGGGIGGALSGALGGAGAGMSLAGTFGAGGGIAAQTGNAGSYFGGQNPYAGNSNFSSFNSAPRTFSLR